MKNKLVIFDCFGVIFDEIAPVFFRRHFDEETAKVLKDKYFIPADMGEITPIRGFVYAPKVNGEGGVIVDYQVEISDDGKTWTPISSVLTFENIVNNPISQEKIFSRYIETRYLRLLPVRAVDTASTDGAESKTYGVSVFGCIQ
jgi:hypothetical protein